MHRTLSPNHIHPVNSRKNLFLVASAILATTAVTQAQVSLSFSTSRTYRQNPQTVDFRPVTGTTPLGVFTVVMWDGSVTVTGCPLNESPTWFGPNPLIGCETGATGYLVGGDLDQDGVRDDFSHWEVSGVVPSVIMEPSRPELAKLYAAPPSQLPRPIGDFLDDTLIVYWDTQTEAIVEYKLAGYRYSRTYGSREEMDREIVPGRYEFAFPQLNEPSRSFVIPVTYYAPPEGFKVQNNVRRGFRFTELNDKPLTWSADGFVQLDPRLINKIEWEGNGAEYIFPALDSLYFSIPDLGNPLPGAPNRDELATTLFPGFVTPGTSRVLLPSPLQNYFIIPPGFIPAPTNAAPNGREGVMQVTLTRAVATSGVATDNSTRTFQLPCRFVNTYEGWAAVSFPAGTPTANRAREADPDRDGFSNYLEWRNNTNPMLATSFPRPPILTFVQGRAERSTESANSGYYQMAEPKTLGAWPPITYAYEFSQDLENWSVVTEDNPDWQVVETDTEIRIQSRHETLSGQGYLRLKATQAPEPETPPTSEE